MTGTDPELPGFDRAEFDRRRKARSLVTGLILGGMVILFFLIAMAKARG